MANADNKHRTAAAVNALESALHITPIERLFLATASLRANAKGQTHYSANQFAADYGSTISEAIIAITNLTRNGYMTRDVDEDGQHCLRLTHHDWSKDYAIITGYGRDAGQKRDGLPPQYGRTADDVIAPNGKRYQPPSETDWRQLVTEEST